MPDISMRDMLKAGVHFGHQTRYWNPKMAPYIYGAYNKVHIINLDHTFLLLKEALNFVSNIASKRGKILFVGTKQSAQNVIREQAERCGMPFLNHRWLGGTLTNYKTVRQSIKRLKELETMRDDGTFSKMIKKEALKLARELQKLDRSIGGIKDMGGIPDAIFVIDVGQEKIAVSEARKLSIPVIGVVDTNNEPDGIDYVIPGNDDAIRAIELYVKAIADMILEVRPADPEPVVKDVVAKKKPAAIKAKAIDASENVEVASEKAVEVEVAAPAAKPAAAPAAKPAAAPAAKPAAKAAAKTVAKAAAKPKATTKKVADAEKPAAKATATKTSSAAASVAASVPSKKKPPVKSEEAATVETNDSESTDGSKNES